MPFPFDDSAGPPARVVASVDHDLIGCRADEERSVSGRTEAPAIRLEIRTDDLRGSAIIRLLEQHVQNMRAISPPCSVHALDLERLRQPDITFWSVWDSAEL